MCLNCGCGEPNESHGKEANITLDDVRRAGEANGQSIEESLRNMGMTARQVVMGQSEHSAKDQVSRHTARPAMPRRMPARFCCDEDLALIGYDGRDAGRDLDRLRSKGPRSETSELIHAVEAQGVNGAVVIDVGAGVGAVHLALLEAGAARAVDVDASPLYLAAAKSEAARRGLSSRVSYVYGDVAEHAADLPAADIVTLDSVICCYPYLDTVLSAVLKPGPRVVGLTYPRETWWMVAFVRLYNLSTLLRRTRAGYFMHRRRDVDRLLGDAGYKPAYDGGLPHWRVSVYAQSATSDAT